MKYSTLLLDADMTLLDFDADEKVALLEVLSLHGIAQTESNVNLYHNINKGLWKSFELGEIKKTDITSRRFCILLEKLGVEGDGIELNREYASRLCFGGRLIDGAKELCRTLHKSGCAVYITTNGTEHIQLARLERSGLTPYLDGIFVSEKIGYQKPMKEYYEYVLDVIPEKNKSRILAVGDSLSSDIKGGLNAGLDTCLFSPYNAEHSETVKPLYTVRRLDEIIEILNQK